MLRRKVKAIDESFPSTSKVQGKNGGSVKTFGVRERLKRHLRLVFVIVLFLWKRFAIYRTFQRSLVWYLTILSDNPEGALWRGTLVRGAISATGETKPRIDLVVSHCNQPLDWMFEWVSPLPLNKITIVSKCGEEVTGAPLSSHIIRLPNVGRCDHTYANFISENYDQYENDGEDRYLLFLKDNDNSNRNIVSRHRNLAEMLAIANQRGFACHEEQSWGWSQGGYWGICQISAYCDWSILSQYTRKEYTRLQRDGNENFLSKHGDTLGEYAAVLGIGEAARAVVPVCFGGNFMAHSQQIQNYPRDTWKRMEQSLSRDNNIAEGHFAERLWATMLSNPLQPSTVDEILLQRHASCQVEKHFLGVLAK